MARRASTQASSQAVIDYLAENGPIFDSSGRATSTLRTAIGYEGSDQSFSQLIASMVCTGAITREVRGKRTFRIAVADDETEVFEKIFTVPALHQIDTPAEVGESQSLRKSTSADIDYDELATSLLVHMVKAFGQGAGANGGEGSWMKRRLERLERHNSEIERSLSQANAEIRALEAQRDELQLQLQHSETNLEVLNERLAAKAPQRRENRVPKPNGLDTEEQALLEALQSGPAKEHSQAS